jgi:hypothetical protein
MSGNDLDKYKALKSLSVYEYFAFIELKTLAQNKIDGSRTDKN